MTQKTSAVRPPASSRSDLPSPPGAWVRGKVFRLQCAVTVRELSSVSPFDRNQEPGTEKIPDSSTLFQVHKPTNSFLAPEGSHGLLSLLNKYLLACGLLFHRGQRLTYLPYEPMWHTTVRDGQYGQIRFTKIGQKSTYLGQKVKSCLQYLLENDF